MKSLGWLLLLVVPAMANAEKLDQLQKQAEASMSLTGSITVGPDGKVSMLTIYYDSEAGNKALNNFVSQTIWQWKFEPQKLDGKPVSVKNWMFLNLIARPLDGGGHDIRIGSVAFRPYVEMTPEEKEAKQAARRKNMRPPRYPEGAQQNGDGSTVYLILKVNPDGSVDDAFAEKVNLHFAGDDEYMELARKAFAEASVRAARRWKISSDYLDGGMQARVALFFCVIGQENCDDQYGYGKWIAYIPGPTLRAPWQKPEASLGFSPDALPANGDIFPVDEAGSLRLLTPFQAEVDKAGI